MYWAENTVGLEKMLNEIQNFANIHGDRWWKPSPLLERMVQNNLSLKEIVNH